MSKKAKRGTKAKHEHISSPDAQALSGISDASVPAKRMSNKAYLKELEQLEAELVYLQEWVIKKGLKVIIVFEGRDGAGKGGTIKALTGRVSPRVFRVVALPAPTDREKTQMYYQRYLPHFPGSGEVVIFDRSWYNRAGVERVMGFATSEEVEAFLRMTPLIEKAMVEGNDIILIKYWLEVDVDEQTRRIKGRITDPRKRWKLSPMDLKSYSRWYDYSRARDAMFEATDSEWAPWFAARSDDKKRVRLNIIKHILSSIPYEVPEAPKVNLPKRQSAGKYVKSAHPVKYVPEVF